MPREGGETVFASQFDADDRLDPELRDRLRGAEVLHAVTGVDPGTGAEVRTWHPLLRRHPLSGRTALYLSTPERCMDLRLPGGSHAPEMVQGLFDHSTAPEGLMRHRWAAGDIVMWDNRCTLHRGDHARSVGPRVVAAAWSRARRRSQPEPSAV